MLRFSRTRTPGRFDIIDVDGVVQKVCHSESEALDWLRNYNFVSPKRRPGRIEQARRAYWSAKRKRSRLFRKAA